MTELLYFKDSHQKTFEAKVTSCVPSANGYDVILDQTAFFPEGGGQKSDLGTIGAVSVLDVQIVEGEVIHTLSSPLQEGKLYTGKIDWNLRFNRMQNHSGEHIVSGIVHNVYGYDNVGFHMADDIVTIDFNGFLTADQLRDVEEKANQAIWDNIPFKCWYPSNEELQTLDFRSKKEIEGDIRLVQIGNVDLCACCAPHVAHSGEIGIIKILSSMKHRGGIRIEMIAGKTAYQKFVEDYDQVRTVSKTLSAKHNEIVMGVERVVSDSESIKQTVYELRESILNEMLNKHSGTRSGNVCEFNSHLTDSMCRDFVNHIAENTDGIVGVFTGNEKDGFHYILGSRTVDLKEIIKDFNDALSGKGGGSSTMMQGNVNCGHDEIVDYFKK